MYGWIDMFSLMVGWLDVWMDGWMDGWLVRVRVRVSWMDECMVGLIYG